jgi:hypothetical protein
VTRHRYWKITSDDIQKYDYDQAKVLNWEIKGVKEPEEDARFIGVFLYKRGTPIDYTPTKGIVLYHNNIAKKEVDEVTKFIKDRFGGDVRDKGIRIFLEGSKEIYSGKEVGSFAKDLETKFSLKATISIEFESLTDEERKKAGLPDAKLLPIPGNHS